MLMGSTVTPADAVVAQSVDQHFWEGNGGPDALGAGHSGTRNCTGADARYASQSTISASAAGAACTNRILRLTVAAP
jgi:hypothetical protein